MIAIQIIDERGTVLETFGDPGIAEFLAPFTPDAFSCLRFLDPYGDTIFNAIQLPVLAEEIRARASENGGSDTSTRLADLAGFVDAAIALLPHVYIRFLGE
jgi:hypothetical protein